MAAEKGSRLPSGVLGGTSRPPDQREEEGAEEEGGELAGRKWRPREIGRAPCRVSVSISGGGGSSNKVRDKGKQKFVGGMWGSVFGQTKVMRWRWGAGVECLV